MVPFLLTTARKQQKISQAQNRLSPRVAPPVASPQVRIGIEVRLGVKPRLSETPKRRHGMCNRFSWSRTEYAACHDLRFDLIGFLLAELRESCSHPGIKNHFEGRRTRWKCLGNMLESNRSQHDHLSISMSSVDIKDH